MYEFGYAYVSDDSWDDHGLTYVHEGDSPATYETVGLAGFDAERTEV